MHAFRRATPHCISTALTLALLLAAPALAYFTTRGDQIVDRRTGEPVMLRGFGIGCWLLPEGYMWDIRRLDRPRQFEAAILDLLGPEDARDFWRRYHDNFFTEGDVAAMKSWGVNSLRIALLASKLQPRDGQPDQPPYVYDEAGFELLDRVVDWCEKYEIGVIWDLHGAPGAQNAENIADSDGVARLWTEPDVYWPRCIDLWRKIAERYRDRDCIIGYDLLNEPLLRRYKGIDPADLRKLYVEITRAIRKIDKDGILFVEGDEWAQDFSMLEPLDWDPHLVVAFHSYPPTANARELERWQKLREKYDIPLWHGETGEVGPPFERNREATAFLESQNVGWSWWTHKKLARRTQPWLCHQTPAFQRIISYWKGEASRPTREVARAALFEQAERTHTKHCEFLPEMVRSLQGLDPDRRATAPPRSATTQPTNGADGGEKRR